MELWKDQQTNQFYLLDITSGQRFPCDQFGKRQIRFRSSFTGVATAEMRKSLKDPTAFPQMKEERSRLYTAQPSKFDGYFQCPRPSSTAFFNDVHDPMNSRPYKPGKMPSNRLQGNTASIPRPITHLTFSRVFDNSPSKKHTKQLRSTQTASASMSFVKSAQDLEKTLQHEKIVMRGYQPPVTKPPRRFFKNFFGLKYSTGNDKFVQEQHLMELTNPVAMTRAHQREMFEEKTMQKRHEAALLKDKIMMGA